MVGEICPLFLMLALPSCIPRRDLNSYFIWRTLIESRVTVSLMSGCNTIFVKLDARE